MVELTGELTFVVAVLGLLLGRGWLVKLGSALMRWLRTRERELEAQLAAERERNRLLREELEAERLSTISTSAPMPNAPIMLEVHGDVFVTTSTHVGDVVESRAAAKSDDDVDAPSCP